MRRELLDYELPPELIATHPPAERDGARLLVLAAAGVTHAAIRSLDLLLAPGSLLVVNDTRVLPARLLGRKQGSGGRVEIFLVRCLSPAQVEKGVLSERWEALGRSSKPLRQGARVIIEGAGRSLTVEIGARTGGEGVLEVRLFTPDGSSIEDAVQALGHIPLPPYLRRPDEAADRTRYQTVFARVPGAVAAPTAGLHLSEALLARLAERGVERASITLHVGLGTFQPVMVEDLDDHPMHAEAFAVPEETAQAIERARARGAPVVAVGTTVVRALESAADPERPGRVRAGEGETRLLIQPGYVFRVVDQLLTNFHLPQSTLLALVAAFVGRERALAAYREAVLARYRFFSYGDAMLLLDKAPA